MELDSRRRHKSGASKTCEVCEAMFFRRLDESDTVWVKRRTCGNTCGHALNARTRNERWRQQRDAAGPKPRRSAAGSRVCCCCHSPDVAGACPDCGRPVCALCKEGKRDLCSECNGSMFV